MTTVFSDADLTLYQGDALATLAELPSQSVDCAVTSPPFFRLRDYGVEGQIGMEEQPEQWAQTLVTVFREMRRVLKDEAVFWIEIGDAYSAGGQGPGAEGSMQRKNPGADTHWRFPPDGYKYKDLIGLPWLLAFALRADGWYLRSEVIWHKTKLMPESVQDRPTRNHSTIFLLSKSRFYHYNADAIRTPYKKDNRKKTTVQQGPNSIQHRNGERWPNPKGANARTVWSLPTSTSRIKHFAPMPVQLAEKMIASGCPDAGTVLDPFAGSGTTLLAARNLLRKGVGIELNPEYCEIISERLAQQSLFA